MKKLLFLLLFVSYASVAQQNLVDKRMEFSVVFSGQPKKLTESIWDAGYEQTLMMSAYICKGHFDYKRFDCDLIKSRDHCQKYGGTIRFYMDSNFDKTLFDQKKSILYLLFMPKQRRA